MAHSGRDIDVARLQDLGLPRWVTRVIHEERVTSTMDVAREIVRAGDAAGALIIAEEQTAGRGRHGAPWVTPRGLGLTFTVLLCPGRDGGPKGLFSLAAALGVRAAVMEHCGDSTRTKWPNDVIVAGRKIAGVLIEVLAQGKGDGAFFPQCGPLQGMTDRGKKGSVPFPLLAIGIGLNVNQGQEDLPRIPGRLATSLAMETGRTHDRSTVLCSVLRALDGLLDEGRRPVADRVIAEWRSADSCLGAELRVRAGNREFRATGRDVTDEGLLVVEGEDGVTEALVAGEVHVVSCHA